MNIEKSFFFVVLVLVWLINYFPFDSQWFIEHIVVGSRDATRSGRLKGVWQTTWYSITTIPHFPCLSHLLADTDWYRVVFLTGPPDFQYQNEKQVAVNQPTNQPISWSPYRGRFDFWRACKSCQGQTGISSIYAQPEQIIFAFPFTTSGVQVNIWESSELCSYRMVSK